VCATRSLLALEQPSTCPRPPNRCSRLVDFSVMGNGVAQDLDCMITTSALSLVLALLSLPFQPLVPAHAALMPVRLSRALATSHCYCPHYHLERSAPSISRIPPRLLRNEARRWTMNAAGRAASPRGCSWECLCVCRQVAGSPTESYRLRLGGGTESRASVYVPSQIQCPTAPHSSPLSLLCLNGELLVSRDYSLNSCVCVDVWASAA
jgi:hypothetical protein